MERKTKIYSIMSEKTNLPENQNQSIYDCITAWAHRQPQSIAITAPERTPLTYQDLYQQINQIIAKLNQIGIGRNDRVAVTLPTGPEMAVAFLAIASCATIAPLNPNYTESEYEFYLSDLNAKALIYQPVIAPNAVKIAQNKGITLLELSPLKQSATGIFQLTGGQPKNPPQPGISQSQDIALVLHTSGTTSRPKIVPLTGKNLCASAENIRLTLNLVETDRCLNIMPLFHIHGLIGALLSSINAGASIICTAGFEAPKFFEWLAEFRPTWYSAVPTMHQAILARAAQNRHIINQYPLRFIRSSSAPLPAQIMTALEAEFNAPVIESYGMTEASHQITSNPLPPKTRKARSVGISAGPQVAIMDHSGNLLPAGEEGEIVIRGANITSGYENNPHANQNAFTNNWFRTGDLGYLDKDNYLFLKSRIKEIINRGGEKISPREIDEVLLDHPAIAQSVTFAAPHKLLGEEVAVAVVLREGCSITEQEIKQFAAAKLADFKVPRLVIFLDEIPKGPTGKLQRIGLAQKLGLTASDPTISRADYIPPQTPLQVELVKIWSEILGIEQVGIYDNFFQLGGDSILATRIVNQVREITNIELSFLFFFQEATVAKMAELITQKQAELVEETEISAMLDQLETLSDEEAENLFFNQE